MTAMAQRRKILELHKLDVGEMRSLRPDRKVNKKERKGQNITEYDPIFNH